MKTLGGKEMLDLITHQALPINNVESLFLDGYRHGFARSLLKDILTENSEVDSMSYEEYLNYTFGYAIGQARIDNLEEEREDEEE